MQPNSSLKFKSIDEITYPIELTSHRHTFKQLLVKNDMQHQQVFSELDHKLEKRMHKINQDYYLAQLIGKQTRLSQELRQKYSSQNIEIRLIKQQPSWHLKSLLQILKQILGSTDLVENNFDYNNHENSLLNKNGVSKSYCDQVQDSSVTKMSAQILLSSQSPTPKKGSSKSKKQKEDSFSDKNGSISINNKNNSFLQQQSQQMPLPPQINKIYKNVYKKCTINKIKGKSDKMEIESSPLPPNEKKNGMAGEQLLLLEEFLKQQQIQQQQQQQAFFQQQHQMMQQYFQMIISNYNNIKNNQIQESEQSAEPIKILPIGNQSQQNRKMVATKTQTEDNQCAFSSQKSKTKSKNNCTHTSSKVKKKMIVKPTNGGLNSDFRAEEKLLLLQQLSSSPNKNQSEATIGND